MKRFLSVPRFLGNRSWLGLIPLALLCTQAGCGDKNPVSGGGSNAAVAAVSSSGVPKSITAFVDIAQKAGLNYQWDIKGKRPLNILQTIGNGCAFLDYNNDGNMDILLVGPRVALYQGDGKGNFPEVSEQTGVAKLSGGFLGCAVGDYDNDGFPDVYLTAYRGGALLHNQNGQTFSDVSKAAHIPAQPWATSAAWADVDGNGTLDLFVGNYVKFGPNTKPQLCDEQGFQTSCGPRHYAPEKNVLYLSDGKGNFRDASQTWNLNKSTGKALGAAFAPLDENSPRPSLYLANDEMPGDLMENSGTSFKNVGAESGAAYDINGNVHGGMGLDWGDFDNDGKLDLFVSTFETEAKCVYHNDGGMLFTEQSARLGLEPITATSLAFGVKWADFDNDGNLDLVVANGHVQDNIAQIKKDSVYKQVPQLIRNTGQNRFEDATAQAGEGFTKKIVGRGLAVGDFDNDGKMDVLIVDSEGAPLLLHNQSAQTGNWAGFKLAGKGAEGALVTVESGPHKWTRLCSTGGSYMSASDSRVHFGLGDEKTVTRVSVRWADGKTQVWDAAKVNAYTTLARK